MGEKVNQNIRINLQEKSGYEFNHYIETQDDEKQTVPHPLSLYDRDELGSTYEDHYLCLIFGFPKYLLVSNTAVLLMKRFIAAGKNIASLLQFITCNPGAHISDLLNA